MNKLREEMAQKFAQALNMAQLPWKACWQQARPQNAVTGSYYRGINAFWLAHIASERGYADPRWCTFRQAADKGWHIQKGASACRIEYWSMRDIKQGKTLSWQEAERIRKNDPEYAEKNLRLRSRIYSVFNANQIDGIPQYEPGHTDIGALRANRDRLIANMDVGYREGGDQAYYSPLKDIVTLPPERSFDDTYGYMATLLHECGHATAHPSRLNRHTGSGKFGSAEYAKEELRAEIAAAFTAQAIGLCLTEMQFIHQMESHMAYVQSWSEVLNKSPEELFRAIRDAETISDYLIEKGEFNMDKEQLYENWEAETNDPKTQEWRDTLTAEQAAVVEKWDSQYDNGIVQMAQDILTPTVSESYYRLFQGDDSYDNEQAALEFQDSRKWQIAFGNESNGLNGDTWLVYRSTTDLPRPLQNILPNLQQVVGCCSWAKPHEYMAFTDTEEYLKMIRRELDYRATSGFRYQTLSTDPSLRKAVDRELYNLFGLDPDIDYDKFDETSEPDKANVEPAASAMEPEFEM